MGSRGSIGVMVLALGLAGCHGNDDEDTGGDTQDDGLVPVDVVSAGVRACTTPIDRDAQGPYERRESPVPRPTDPWIWHGGVVAGDFNGDGFLDMATALEQGMELYEGTATGDFVLRGQTVFAGMDLTYASGGSAADYDGDGDLDLYVTRIAGSPAPEGAEYGMNRLLQNQGNGTFVDVTASAGVGACGLDFRDGATRCFKSMASAWGDIDGDGDLDLYVGDYGFVDETDGTKQEDMMPAERDFVYRNEGNGGFTDISDVLPNEVHEGYTYAGGWLDLDDDGDLDLYTVNDFGNLWPNRVVWNDGAGNFAFDPAEPSQLAKSMTGMGLGVGDLNGDGRMDLAVAEWKKNTLFESRAPDEASGTPAYWIDVADRSAFRVDDTRGQQVGWGTMMGDVDNDGDLDLLNQYGHVVNGNSVWANDLYQADGLYLNDGNGASYTFTDVGQSFGVDDPGMSRGAVFADVNGDGWLDIAKRSLDSSNVVYVSRCGTASWVEVVLSQPGTMNTDAVGAKITVAAGGRTLTGWIIAGGVGYASAPPLEAHFGLGSAQVVDEIRVQWPGGGESVVTGQAVNQRLTLVRGD